MSNSLTRQMDVTVYYRATPHGHEILGMLPDANTPDEKAAARRVVERHLTGDARRKVLAALLLDRIPVPDDVPTPGRATTRSDTSRERGSRGRSA